MVYIRLPCSLPLTHFTHYPSPFWWILPLGTTFYSMRVLLSLGKSGSDILAIMALLTLSIRGSGSVRHSLFLNVEPTLYSWAMAWLCGDRCAEPARGALNIPHWHRRIPGWERRYIIAPTLHFGTQYLLRCSSPWCILWQTWPGPPIWCWQPVLHRYVQYWEPVGLYFLPLGIVTTLLIVS